jgi:glycosyltransferase involved in cell wall biosynthesis
VRASPPVSVVIPTWNGAAWIRDTIASALAQTFQDFEVLVADDGSSDGTVELARAVEDARVRVVAFGQNVGIIGNWNRATAHARGELIKYLFQDDLLEPACLSTMVERFRERPDAGMVFSRREMLIDAEGDSEAAAAWWERFATLHAAYGTVPRWSEAGDLFRPWAAAKCIGNWIGEPTCVMVRRGAFVKTGLFHRRMVQLADMEMWARLAFHFPVGFVDEALCRFRVHAKSATRRHTTGARDWLDRLWMLDGLLDDAEIAAARPDVAKMRRHEARAVAKRLLRGHGADTRLTPKRAIPGARIWVGHRLERLARVRVPLHPPLAENRGRERVRATDDPGGTPRTDAT